MGRPTMLERPTIIGVLTLVSISLLTKAAGRRMAWRSKASGRQRDLPHVFRVKAIHILPGDTGAAPAARRSASQRQLTRIP